MLVCIVFSLLSAMSSCVCCLCLCLRLCLCLFCCHFAYANEMLQPLQQQLFFCSQALHVFMCVYVCVLAVFTALAKQTNRAYGKEIAHTTMPKWPKMAVGSGICAFGCPLPHAACHRMAHATCRPFHYAAFESFTSESISLQRLELGSLTL